MKPDIRFLFTDPAESAKDPDWDLLEVQTARGRLVGSLLSAAGEAPHPCVVMLHGYPGVASNHDIGVALARAGCTVAMPFHTGAWGSEGVYRFSNLVPDAEDVCRHMRAHAVEYGLDAENIFLFGYSMGGFTALNALRRLSYIRGAALIVPYDPTRALADGNEAALRSLLSEGRFLSGYDEDALIQDARACMQAGMGFNDAFEDVKDKNLLFVGGTRDTVAPMQYMIAPLWQRLYKYGSPALQACFSFEASHGFCTNRIELTKTVANWLAAVSEM